jgi:hypothetical protein
VIWSFPTRAVSTVSAGGSPRLACNASPLISAHPPPPNHKQNLARESESARVSFDRRRDPTEVRELRGATLELELVAGE